MSGKTAKAARSLSPVLLLLLLAAGCGGGGSTPGANTSALFIRPAKASIDTNATDQLSAQFASGASAAVNWSIVEGQNDPSIGQGAISASGLYTPPPLLSRDRINVEVKAAARNAPAISATYLLTVTPGFVQSLTPENAALAPGGTVRVTGEIAEVNSGSMRWSLRPSPGSGIDLSANDESQYGSIGKPECSYSSETYTSCTAIYTAPSSVPGNTLLYLVASLDGSSHSAAALHILLNDTGINSSPLEHQAAQTGDVVELGSSGGNANDYDSSPDSHGDQYVNDCCGGTLGALVEDQNSDLYILSNNHVLAESDQARTGDTIVEPALIDQDCNPDAGRTVGALRYVVPLESPQTNVDAALAAATPAVDSSGGILELGPASHGALSPAAPAAGSGEALTATTLNQLRVVKSGRTTGLTCSAVNTVDLTVNVDYYYDCAETKPLYTKTYTGQIGIPGISFADSGDSGALVMDASNAEAVGLLFASGAGENNSGFSVANPIQDVLGELSQKSQAEGLQFKIVGGAPHPVTCSNYDQNAAPLENNNLNAAQLAAAQSAADTAYTLLVRPDNGILGVSTGRSMDRPEEAAVVVYTDQSKANVAVPKMIDGLRTLVIQTDQAGADAEIAPASPPPGIHLAPEVLRAAAQVERQVASKLMGDPAFFGVGVTQSYDNPAEAALLVLVDPTKTPKAMPDVVGGLRVRYLRIHRLHVTRSRSSSGTRPTSCQLRAQRRVFPNF